MTYTFSWNKVTKPHEKLLDAMTRVDKLSEIDQNDRCGDHWGEISDTINDLLMSIECLEMRLYKASMMIKKMEAELRTFQEKES